jgi:hypothetical protein
MTQTATGTVGARLLADETIRASIDAIVERVEAASAAAVPLHRLGRGQRCAGRAGRRLGQVGHDHGIGVHFFGHSHPELVRASLAGSIEDTAKHGNLQRASRRTSSARPSSSSRSARATSSTAS